MKSVAQVRQIIVQILLEFFKHLNRHDNTCFFLLSSRSAPAPSQYDVDRSAAKKRFLIELRAVELFSLLNR